MPAYLEKDLPTSYMPDREFLRVGFINNMPGVAAEVTEKQFMRLLNCAANDMNVLVSFYSLRDLSRSEGGPGRLSCRYLPVENLLHDKLDGLIVTGAEPRAPQLTGEAYWRSLASVIDWAEQNTLSTIWSCLAAHAAVLHLNGIRRRLLEAKRFGVFDFSQASDHYLMYGVAPVIQIPHSRWNDLEAEQLRECGYEILTCSSHGVDTFIKQRKSLFVFFQGHPEYDSDTLLLEYQRDIGRYLRRERDVYPSQPHGYFDLPATAALNDLRERCLADRRKELLADFPRCGAGKKEIKTVWQPVALCIYRNWLGYLSAEKRGANSGTHANPVQARAGIPGSANA